MFVYYIEKPNADVEDLINDGLGYAFDKNGSIAKQGVQRGPEGRGAGMVFGRSSSRIQTSPDWTWFPIPESKSGILCGYNPAQPPTPADLIRDSITPGNEIKLPDGRRWIIPKARTVDDEGSLDLQKLSLEWDGKDFIVGKPLDIEFHAIATSVWDAFKGYEDGSFMMPDNTGHLIVRLLSMNYFVGPTEICKLNLLTSSPDDQWDVLSQVIDFPAIVEWSKKKGFGPKTPSETHG